MLFSPKGEVCTCPDGRGDASQDAGWFTAPPIFSFWLRQKEKTGRARSKREKALRLNIRGIPNGGAPGVTERSCLYICPRRMDLYCFAAGDEGVVHLSHAFLGRLLESRLLLIPSSLRLSSPAGYPSSLVLRLSSFVPRLQGECSRGDRSPLLISGGGNGTEWMLPQRGSGMEWNFRRCGTAVPS